MRILCVTPWFPAVPGAQSGNFIHDSVVALRAMGNDVKVVVAQPWHPALGAILHPDWGRQRLRVDAHAPALAVERIGFLSVPRNYLRGLSDTLFDLRVRPAIVRIAREFKPDVICAHTELIGRAAVAARAEVGVPVAVVLHGIDASPRLNTPGQLRAVGRALARADRVILVGEPLHQHFQPIAGRSDHFRVVHNGFMPPSMQDSGCREEMNARVRLVSVSNLHEGKGVDLNLQALGRLYHQGRRNWFYTIVGDGRERDALENMARELGIADHVRFVGAVAHAQVYSYLCEADVFLLPSYREAFGIAYLEAMACGLLTIGVSGQGPSAFIRHEETGLLVAPNDVGSIVDILHVILVRPAFMRRVAENGKAFVCAEFTWARHAEKMMCALREIASQPGQVKML